MLNVLISAYSCEPGKGSEPGVGWHLALEISKGAKVWVIARRTNRESIEQELSKIEHNNLNFIYYDLPKSLSFWKKGNKGLYLYYFFWQIGAFSVVKKQLKKIRPDLVHHLTFGSIWAPTFIHLLGLPFVWGPIGGGESVPRTFRRTFLLKEKIKEYIRDVLKASLAINPFIICVLKKASAIIVKTEDTLKIIPKKYKNKTFKMIETGCQPLNISLGKSKVNDKIIIISIGRLISWKGIRLGILAFSEASKRKENLELWIIGDGPDRKKLEKLVYKERLSEKVFFTGYLPRNIVFDKLLSAHIYLHPSLKDGGPWPLFEAMECGLPIICLDAGGVSDIVTDEIGIKLTPIKEDQVIRDISNAILKLANNEDLRNKMGEAAKKRADEIYTWQRKGQEIIKIYNLILNKACLQNKL